MAKKKKKWKKRLGKALMAGAALAGGLALAKNRSRAASIADNEAKESGFGAMKLKDYGPHTIGNYHTPRTDSVLASPKWDNWSASYMPLKKGGRVGVGKAKRGFGRALKKGK